MGEHYVPQYYLRAFGIPDDPSLTWMYDKHTGHTALAAIDKVAQQRDFYADDVEEWLTEAIEQPANVVLDKIRLRREITLDEKRSLCDYMAVMLTRVPKGRERLMSYFCDAKDTVLDRIEARWMKAMNERPDLAEQLKRRLLDLKVRRDEYERMLREAVEWRVANPPLWPQVSAALNTMTWRLLVSDSDSSLITGDNPVFFFESWGLGNPQSEVSFPISRDIALWAG